MSDVWYYVENEAQTGPVSYEQLRKFLVSPRGGKTALVWHKGLSDWKQAGEVNELADIFEGPPPIPIPVHQPPIFPPQATPAVVALASDQVVKPPAQEGFGKKALGISASIGGGLIGIVAVKIFGAALIWPAVLIGITWLILAKCRVESVAVPMLAFVIGHTGWMIVGNAILYANDNLQDLWFLADVIGVTGLSIWFLMARSRAAAIGILVYQICSLGFGVTMAEESIPGISSQALALGQTMHIILRIAGIGLCIYGVAKLGKTRLAADPLNA